jgi:hypothetical protein
MPTTSKIAQKLYLPDEAKPAYMCEICGLMFYRDELDAYGKHMKKCSDQHEAEIMVTRSSRYQMREVLAVGDPERDEWVKKNRRAIIEGRKRM